MKPDRSHSGKAGATAYSVAGEGEPLVLIHGVGMTRAAWAPQVEAFAADFKVVSYDMLGHGQSERPPEDATLADYARQLATLLDHLENPVASVVGHSMGALVALEFALTFPARTRRVAALNAVFRRDAQQRAAVTARAQSLQDGVVAGIEATMERWFGHPVPAALQLQAASVARMLREVDPVGYARTYRLFASSDAVHAESLATLAPAALFMTGELDPNSSPDMSRAMAALAPKAQLDIVADARHMMNLTHPQRVNASLRRFLLDGQG